MVINSYDTPAYASCAGLAGSNGADSASYTGASAFLRAIPRATTPDGSKTGAFYESLLRASDACLFYSDYPAKKYAAQGWPERDALHRAQYGAPSGGTNTPCNKDTVLFLGSLYPQKGFDELLEQYDLACRENANVPRLVIIGDGSERERIETWVRKHGLLERVEFTGAIFDDAVLGRYFAAAIACVSPNQAGLTVLKSMGCGVPYITRRDAITGGELFNIHDRKDGVLYDRPEELKGILLDLTEHPETFMLYGRNALAFYESSRKPEDMVNGFLAAISYAHRKLEERRKRR